MDVIDDFIRRYRKEYDYYAEVARMVEQRCSNSLETAGIRAIVTHRAKRPDSLLRKLRQRADKKYTSVDDIYADVHDLAGARIALYFPADREKVGKILEQEFSLVETPKQFPNQSFKPAYEKRFSGYWATHYRVRLNEAALSESQQRYGDAKVEIQVASVLMHAWAEVEHDLVYKPSIGELSVDEYAALDQINGLVLAGEIALERLQRALERRVERKGAAFSNHYELAAYLYDAAKHLLQSAAEPVVGRVDILFQFLKRKGLATTEALTPFLKQLELDTERRPLADQIVDQIMAIDPETYDIYLSVRRELRPDPLFQPGADESAIEWQHAFGMFMTNWIKLERILRELTELFHIGNRPVVTMRTTSMLPVLTEDEQYEIARIRRARNALVHGVEMPDTRYLEEMTDKLNRLIERLANNPQEVVRSAVRRALDGFNIEPPQLRF